MATAGLDTSKVTVDPEDACPSSIYSAADYRAPLHRRSLRALLADAAPVHGHRGVSEPLLADRPEPLKLRNARFPGLCAASQTGNTLNGVRRYLSTGNGVLLPPNQTSASCHATSTALTTRDPHARLLLLSVPTASGKLSGPKTSELTLGMAEPPVDQQNTEWLNEYQKALDETRV